MGVVVGVEQVLLMVRIYCSTSSEYLSMVTSLSSFDPSLILPPGHLITCTCTLLSPGSDS